MMSRGKYTLLMRFALLIRLLDDSDSAVETNCQGNNPAKTISAYGAAPSVGNLATLPNRMVNTTMVRKGLINAHVTPMIVCL